MKTAKEIKIDGRTYTVFECQNCGSTTRTTGRQTAKKAQTALNRECRSCSPVRFGRSSAGWWKDLSLSNNPYVYGPMPYKRTSKRYRLEEARRMGWVAWTWQDEYTEERKAVTEQLNKSPTPNT